VLNGVKWSRFFSASPTKRNGCSTVSASVPVVSGVTWRIFAATDGEMSDRSFSGVS